MGSTHFLTRGLEHVGTNVPAGAGLQLQAADQAARDGKNDAGNATRRRLSAALQRPDAQSSRVTLATTGRQRLPRYKNDRPATNRVPHGLGNSRLQRLRSKQTSASWLLAVVLMLPRRVSEGCVTHRVDPGQAAASSCRDTAAMTV